MTARWFAYDPDRGGFQVVATEQDVRDHAVECIEFLRNDAPEKGAFVDEDDGFDVELQKI